MAEINSDLQSFYHKCAEFCNISYYFNTFRMGTVMKRYLIPLGADVSNFRSSYNPGLWGDTNRSISFDYPISLDLFGWPRDEEEDVVMVQKARFIVFRGTDFQDLKQWVENALNFDAIPWKSSKGTPLGFGGKGYLEAYQAIKECTDVPLLDELDYAEQYCDGTVVIIGHSMGAGIATLMAREILADYLGSKVKRLILITVASPRTLDTEAADLLFNAANSDCHHFFQARLVNTNDPAPTFPVVDFYPGDNGDTNPVDAKVRFKHCCNPIYYNAVENIWEHVPEQNFPEKSTVVKVETVNEHRLASSVGYLSRLKPK